MSERATLHLEVRGRVQGVGYRYAMLQEAVRLGVSGWVRNRRDGSVEAVVHGDPAAVAALRAWAERGPPEAGVAAVAASPTQGSFERFELRPTA
jgi:acylphosphatase